MWSIITVPPQVTVAHINATAKNAADDKLRQSLRRFAETHTAPATVVLVSCEFSSDVISTMRYNLNARFTDNRRCCPLIGKSRCELRQWAEWPAPSPWFPGNPRPWQPYVFGPAAARPQPGGLSGDHSWPAATHACQSAGRSHRWVIRNERIRFAMLGVE